MYEEKLVKNYMNNLAFCDIKVEYIFYKSGRSLKICEKIYFKLLG